MTPISFTLPLRILSEKNMHESRFVKARRTRVHRTTTKLFLYSRLHDIRAALAAGARLVVTLTRVAPLKLDSDNVVFSASACRDGVADALEIDDRDSRVDWRYGQRRAIPGEPGLMPVRGRESRVAPKGRVDWYGIVITIERAGEEAAE